MLMVLLFRILLGQLNVIQFLQPGFTPEHTAMSDDEGSDGDGLDDHNIEAEEVNVEDLTFVDSDNEEAVLDAALNGNSGGVEEDEGESEFIENRNIEPERDDSILTFDAHKVSVFAKFCKRNC